MELYALMGISTVLIVTLLILVIKKSMDDPGLNARIVITWGEKVNDAIGGTADILDDELGGTTIVSGSLNVHHVMLEELESGEVVRGRFIRELVIGREPRGSDGYVAVAAQGASRLHCRIFWNDGAMYLEDLNSSNHTYLNGQMVSAPVRLQDEDIIYMGREAYRFRNLG